MFNHRTSSLIAASGRQFPKMCRPPADYLITASTTNASLLPKLLKLPISGPAQAALNVKTGRQQRFHLDDIRFTEY